MTKGNFMQLTLNQPEIEQALYKFTCQMLSIRRDEKISVSLVESRNGAGLVAIINILPADDVATPMTAVPVSVPLIAEKIPVVVPAKVMANENIHQAIVEAVAEAVAPVVAPVAAVRQTAEERITAKFGPGLAPATPVTSLFNKAKPPQTPAEVRAIMDAASDDDEGSVEVASSEEVPMIVEAAVVEAVVNKPQSLFKNLRKPVNA
jgi:hypothetical protein